MPISFLPCLKNVILNTYWRLLTNKDTDQGKEELLKILCLEIPCIFLLRVLNFCSNLQTWEKSHKVDSCLPYSDDEVVTNTWLLAPCPSPVLKCAMRSPEPRDLRDLWAENVFSMLSIKLENAGIDPATSHMLSERSTIWANSPPDETHFSLTHPNIWKEFRIPGCKL